VLVKVQKLRNLRSKIILEPVTSVLRLAVLKRFLASIVLNLFLIYTVMPAC